METILPELPKAIISLLVVVDPLGNIPIFISLTEGMEKDERKRTFNTATIVGFIVLMAFAIIGREVLRIFGITIHSFMIAGGILLGIIAVKILVQGGWREMEDTPEDIGAVPIAFPLLVGPGAITTTIVILQSSGFYTAVITVAVIFFIVWLTLHFIDSIYRLLGRTGSAVVGRVMAIFIAALAVQFIIEGVKHTIIF